MSLLKHYKALLSEKGFERDPRQESILEAFDRLVGELQETPKPRSWFRKKWIEPVKGIYLWGGVGRGKTWLMDLFYQKQKGIGIERNHFHSFMRQIHSQLKQREGSGTPMEQIVSDMAGRMRVLCLDEFNVIDIGDAMLMRSLLEAMEKSRITLVTTSNQHPDNLYRGGIQRESFLPAIDILKRTNRIVELQGNKDYRLQLFETSAVYHTPLGDAATISLSREFDRLANGSVENMGRFTVPGRPVRYLKRAGGVIWCDFNALCGPPRWQNDYLELARCHHTVFISDIPHLDGTWDDRTRRFINLVDVFYDQKVKLVISAEERSDRLYTGTRLAFEFKRTASRLQQMQSAAYLEMPHIG
ncbi:MAG: AFG1 family ATPase [Candidatus Thiodiazotropha sp. (ex Dulcina madagascariensis)]|nr:AFG1 family ATPase [Candidatus Thiodiazotropha sp. (ex Dulcina madagascariensis)]MCU7927455.1 AFG1 family ATPase [Candidatus Thiodiazotropha sp. (ex Dulcina madagascariensis)]